MGRVQKRAGQTCPPVLTQEVREEWTRIKISYHCPNIVVFLDVGDQLRKNVMKGSISGLF